jgi:hypothetical protein
VWELHVEGLRLHAGGEFEKVSGVVQNSYARLSPASPQEEAYGVVKTLRRGLQVRFYLFPSRQREYA